MNDARLRLLSNVMSLGAVQIFSYLLPFLSLPYLARSLGPNELGRMAFALSIAQIFVIFTDYGFNLSGPKAIALAKGQREEITEIWCVVTWLRTIFAIAGLALLTMLLPWCQAIRENWDLIYIAYTLVIGNIIFPQWLFQGLERLRFVSIVQIGARLLVFAATFCIVHHPTDVRLATALQSLGPLLGGILTLPHTLHSLSTSQIKLPSKSTILHHLREGWHIFMSTAAINIYTSCNSFMLGLFVQPSTLGHYHVAEKLCKAVQMALSPISNAVYPMISRLAVDNKQAAVIFARNLLLIMGGGSLVISVLIFATAHLIVHELFGDGYEEAALLLQIMASLPFLVALSNVLGIQTMLPLGHKQAFSRILIAAAAIDLVTFTPAVLLYDARGAAWTNVVVELFVTLSMAYLLHRAGLSLVQFPSRSRRP